MPFTKGQSGNPAGRPPKNQELTNLLRVALSHKGEDGIPLRKAMTEKLAQMAAGGDLDAIKVVLERIDGKVPETRVVEGGLDINLSWDDGSSE